jgi:PAS domain S-box-containing protein
MTSPPAVSALERVANFQDERFDKLILDASPYAIVVVDGARKIAFANRGAETLFGYGRNELAGLDLDALIPARYRQAHARHVSKFLRWPFSRAMPAAGSLAGRRKDGSEVPIEIALNPIETPKGAFVLATIMSVEGRRYHEEALRLAVEAAPNAILAIDELAQIVFANARAESLFGYAHGELDRQSIRVLVPEKFRMLPADLIAKFLRKDRFRSFGRGRDLFGRRKDGSEVPVDLGLSSLDSPRGRLTLVSIADISERWRYEDELRRSREEAIKDKQRAEDRALLLRRVWDEIAALGVRCGLSDIGETPALFQEACQSAFSADASLAAVLTPFETAFRGYMEANSKLAEQNRKLAVAKAVTEAANRELEAFSYSVAHDLRAPLRSVNGFCQILEEEYVGCLDDTGRGYLDRVRRAAQHMGALIDDLLRLARIAQGDLSRSTVNLSAIAGHIEKTLRDNDPERIAEFAIEQNVFVNGNPRLLRIVLENLFSNAWKFTAKEPAARIEFGSEKAGGETVIFVRDNGVGFDMAYAGKLFGAFQRLHNGRDFPGTGIGLATARRIVTKHGGRIWTESKPGRGATFSFVL